MKKNLALEFLYRCVTPHGFVASPAQQDNYHRIWSRDAVIMGLSAALCNDTELLVTLKESIRTLGYFQAENGQIPSNVDVTTNKASYGTLAGRIDATTWWIIGACISIKNDSSLLGSLKPKIEKAFYVLDAWEMNQRGLLYTPLGGNWADEYVTQGYVLYDQLLRLWAFRAWYKIEPNQELKYRILQLEGLLVSTYNLESDLDTRYHQTAYENLVNKPLYWAATLQPSGYDTRWDMSANALALLLKLPFNNKNIGLFLNQLEVEFKHNLYPVFYPIIQKTDWEWRLLENNHLYTFKNHPYCFHNGGAWPVFLGLLSLGLSANGLEEHTKKIWTDFEEKTDRHPKAMFTEYWNTQTGEPGGVSELGFSASGTLLMFLASKNSYDLKDIML